MDASDLVIEFIARKCPVVSKLYLPFCATNYKFGLAGAKILSIKTHIYVNRDENGNFIFREPDRVLVGKIERIRETDFIKEVEYLESIADNIVAGHNSFYTAFCAKRMPGNYISAVLLGVEYKLKLDMRNFDMCNAIEQSSDIIQKRNQYLAAKKCLAILPMPITDAICEALSYYYI